MTDHDDRPLSERYAAILAELRASTTQEEHAEAVERFFQLANESSPPGDAKAEAAVDRIRRYLLAEPARESALARLAGFPFSTATQ